MGRRGGPWQDGRRAWARLDGWHQDDPSATPGHPDNGSAAVDALADIGHIRHLLDQAELVAVRTARRHGKSWAEIATKLGVTRQSAWERWRDLEDTATPPPAPEPPSEPGIALKAAAAEVIETSRPRDFQVLDMRQPSTVLVPNVIGLSWRKAQEVLGESSLVAVDADPALATSQPDSVITDQIPESGAIASVGSSVRLWRKRGGGSAGVREPRRPKPPPRSAREMRYEPTDEAIG